MRIGTSSGEYIRYGLAEGARIAKKHGYSCFDYNRFTDTETEFFRLPEEEFKKELIRQKNIYESEGITVWQAHAPWRWPVRDSTPEDRAERLNSMSKAIRGCSYLGCPNFVVHVIMPFGVDSPDNADEMKRMNFEFMSKLGEVAKEYGVKHINIENLPFKNLPINYTPQVLDFVKSLNSVHGGDIFKVCFDTGHSNYCGENIAEMIELLGSEHLGVLHVHDNDGTSDQHLAPGLGNIDWDSFSKALVKIGFDGVLNLEVHPLKSEEEQLQVANITRKLA